MDRESLPTSEMASTSDDFEALYQSNAPLVYRFMLWRTKDRMLAEDLTSNVFEKAWRTRQNFTGGSVKAWLFRIASTTLIDHWRKNKEPISADEATIAEVASEDVALDCALDQKLLIEQMQTAVNKLPKSMQSVVRLRFIEGRSARETAKALHISEANVRVIQYRALKKLREHMQ